MMNSIILAGGKSRRLGRNKALISLNKTTLIETLIAKLKPVSKNIYVIGSQETDYSFLKGVNILEDLIPEKGPLGGLYTGLSYSNEQYNLLLACDMPFLSTAYFNFLASCQKDYQVLIPEFRGYLEPLAGIYSLECLPAIKASLDKGNLKIKSFYPEVKVRVLREEIISKVGEPANLFFNINCRSDLEKLAGYLEA